MNRSKLLTRSDVFNLIAAGDVIVIKDGNVLRLNHWLEKHPGGRLSIQHMVGRDATDEIHISHVAGILDGMNRYAVGKVSGPWKNFVPPIQGGNYSGTEDENSPLASNVEAEVTPDVVLPLFPALSQAVDQKDLEHTMTPAAFLDNAIKQDIAASSAEFPPLDATTQASITAEFQDLHRMVHESGFYECDYMQYGKEFIRYAVLFAAFVGFLAYGWYITSAIFLGLWWQQIMFTAHDAGHRAITRSLVLDTLVGIFIGDFCCGLSIGWWKSSHNVHHLVTNSPEHDPDIQNTPLFAISPALLQPVSSSYYNGFVFPYDSVAAFALQYQSLTYYPIMAVARFNLYFLSWTHLLNRTKPSIGRVSWTRPAELLSIAGYLFWYGYIVNYKCIPTWQARATFIIISHLITMLLHVQITLSHWGMPTALLPGESFAQHQLRTTMDIDCPPWLDFFHGGLQFQAIHHLFPRVPRHNLRKLQPHVKDFCARTGIKYSILGFSDGNKKVLGKLDEITKQVLLLTKCQMHMAATGESGLH